MNDDESKEKPLLCLTMIVRNEAASIEEIIQSVADQIDCYAIVDTGSDDGTIEIAEKALTKAGIPGKILLTSFIDFSQARNASLELAESLRATWGLVLSGDETLVDPTRALRRFCKEHRDDTNTNSFNIQVQFASSRFDSTRLARLNAGWRYQGKIHEALIRDGMPSPSDRVPDCFIFHNGEAADPDRKRIRMYKDLEILREQVRKTPDDARSQFYLAQTLEDLGFTEQAHVAYKIRMSLGGWIEEHYEAAFRVARTGLFLGMSNHELVEMNLEAYAIDPRRAEPLHAISFAYYFRKQWPQCWIFASQGAAIPYPKDCRLFVDQDVYSYKLADMAGVSGYHTGHFELGEKYARQAAAARPNDERIKRNLDFYLKRQER